MADIGKVDEILRNFRKAKDFDGNRFDDYEELNAFYEGTQSTLSKYQSDKPWVVDIDTPHAKVSINKRLASLSAKDYMGELQPLSEEDIEFVDTLNKIVRNEWLRLNLDKEIKRTVARSAVVREGYLHIRYDADKIIGGRGTKQEGALEADFIESSSVLADPEALEFKDGEFAIVVARISRQKAKGMYDFDVKKETGSMLTNEDRGEIYDHDYHTEQEKALTQIYYYEKVYEDKKVFIKRYIVVEKKIVDTIELPITRFPIIQFRWEKKAKSPYGISLMDDVLSAQKATNSIESATTNSALAYASPNIVVTLESGLDPEEVANVVGAPGVVFQVTGDPKNSIQVLQLPGINRDIVTISENFKGTIKEVTGDTAEFTGELGTAGNTSGGAREAISRATIIETNTIELIEEFVEEITRVIVEYIVNLFKDQSIYVIDGKGGKIRSEKVDVDEDLATTQFSFNINLDAKTQYSRERERQLMMEIWQMERQYDTENKVIDITDLIESSETIKKDELILRVKEAQVKTNEQKAQIIMQLNTVAPKLGIPQEIIMRGITEIMAGGETPVVDQIIQLIQQRQGQLQQAVQQKQQAQEQQIKQMQQMAGGQGQQ